MHILSLQTKEAYDWQPKPLNRVRSEGSLVLHLLSSEFVIYFLSYLSVLQHDGLRATGQPRDLQNSGLPRWGSK